MKSSNGNQPRSWKRILATVLLSVSILSIVAIMFIASVYYGGSALEISPSKASLARSGHVSDLASVASVVSTEGFFGGGDGSVTPVIPMQKDTIPYHSNMENRDKFESKNDNSVKVAKEEPVSTFSIDVDTASYAFVRAALSRNRLPPKDAVRIEELINYFPYTYPSSEQKETPFKVNVTVFPTPWNPATKIMHIGIKGYQLEPTNRPKANLVYLIDTSGSMLEPNKLPLLQTAIKMLVDSLDSNDSVAIVSYAGNAGVVLPPTPGSQKQKIKDAIDALRANGSTAGEAGLQQAYALAKENFDKNSINRVILATDGDFNVGISNPSDLKRYIEHERKSGVFLSVLGFGMGNYNDELMQALAQNGNGNAAYIDNLNEARKVLVDEAGSTLFPIAKDVKIQVEFNPQRVAEYRLIGYETRLLNREDFHNDQVDAGEIGAGHAVTALYEVTPVESPGRLVDDLRYSGDKTATATTDEYAFVKIRYKQPDAKNSNLITQPVRDEQEVKGLVPEEPKFAAAVAAFGQLLKGSVYLGTFGYDDVIKLAQESKGDDPFGYRAEFINLVRVAKNAPALPGAS